MSIGSNIKKIRESKNISIKEMSNSLKMFKKRYVRIEKGIILPNNFLLRRISKIFNLSLNELVNYNDDKNRLDKTRLDLEKPKIPR